MARTQFTFTFTNAQPGSVVSFGDAVLDHLYADETSSTRLGRPLILNSSNALSLWSDVETLTATTEDGSGTDISATATRANPTVTTDAGTAGQNPFGTGGSVPVYAQYLWEGGAGQVHHVYTQAPWTTDLVVGTQLFDVTDPAAPLALADGFYQLLGSCYGFPGVDSTADIFVGADWNLNGPGPFSTYATHPIGKTYPGGFGWDVPIYGEWFVRAGQVVGVAVNHADTTQTLDITTSVVVRFQPGSAPEDFPAV